MKYFTYYLLYISPEREVLGLQYINTMGASLSSFKIGRSSSKEEEKPTATTTKTAAATVTPKKKKSGWPKGKPRGKKKATKDTPKKKSTGTKYAVVLPPHHAVSQSRGSNGKFAKTTPKKKSTSSTIKSKVTTATKKGKYDDIGNGKGPTRQSRRTAKANPPKVFFPTFPKSKTPSKKFPLTPSTRTKVESKSKPILLKRKSPRVVKHKFIKGKSTTNSLKSSLSSKYTPNATYDVDELIFAWDKKVLYEAKVTSIKFICNKDGSPTDIIDKYQVHYLGYKKMHDKWIGIDKMLKVDYDSNKYFKESRGKLAFEDGRWGEVWGH